MNKTTLLLTVIYLGIILYFAVFNWNIFVLELDVNLGVKVIQAPLIALIFLLGFLFFLLVWLSSSFSNLLINKKMAKSNKELFTLKAMQKLNVNEKLELLTKKLDLIDRKLELKKQNSEID